VAAAGHREDVEGRVELFLGEVPVADVAATVMRWAEHLGAHQRGADLVEHEAFDRLASATRAAFVESIAFGPGGRGAATVRPARPIRRDRAWRW
jgi:hypothetical protein